MVAWLSNQVCVYCVNYVGVNDSTCLHSWGKPLACQGEVYHILI